MSLQTRLSGIFNQIALDIKQLKTNDGDLSSLPTTNKTNLVASITELYGLLGNAGATIDDNAGNGATSVVWSADKVFDEIEAAKTAVTSALLDGAPAALDTLNELAAALNDDPAFATTLATQINNKVDYSTAQVLTAGQRLQACENIGIGDPETDFLATYIATRDA